MSCQSRTNESVGAGLGFRARRAPSPAPPGAPAPRRGGRGRPGASAARRPSPCPRQRPAGSPRSAPRRLRVAGLGLPPAALGLLRPRFSACSLWAWRAWKAGARSTPTGGSAPDANAAHRPARPARQPMSNPSTKGTARLGRGDAAGGGGASRAGAGIERPAAPDTRGRSRPGFHRPRRGTNTAGSDGLP